MPPRYAYWTILIDHKPTAFRAREREELLPTFNQLRRKNADVVMKWFARGRLWASPEEAQAAQHTPKPPREARGSAWRPGGEHRDPRDRFKKRTTPQGGRPDIRRDREKLGPPRESRPRADRTKTGPPRGDRTWDGKPPNTAPRREAPSGKPPWRDKPQGYSVRGSRPSPGDASRQTNRQPFSPRDRKPLSPPGGGDQRRAWPRDRPVERREANAPPNRKSEPPSSPPPTEPIVRKPDPSEQG